MLVDSAAPEVDHPENITYEFGQTGNTVAWNADDRFPLGYSIDRNGIQLYNAMWDRPTISVVIDGLDMGWYNYTLVVYDMAVNTAADSVIVNVIPPMAGPTDTTLVVVASVVSAVLVAALVTAIKKLE